MAQIIFYNGHSCSIPIRRQAILHRGVPFPVEHGAPKFNTTSVWNSAVKAWEATAIHSRERKCLLSFSLSSLTPAHYLRVAGIWRSVEMIMLHLHNVTINAYFQLSFVQRTDTQRRGFAELVTFDDAITDRRSTVTIIKGLSASVSGADSIDKKVAVQTVSLWLN